MPIVLTTDPEIMSCVLTIQEDNADKVDMVIMMRAYAGIVPYLIPVEIKNRDISAPLDPEFWETFWGSDSPSAWSAAGFTPL